MQYPYLVPERFCLPIYEMSQLGIRSAFNKRLHPLFLFHMQGREKILYIENDTDTIIITIERRRKPVRKLPNNLKPKLLKPHL